MSYELPSVPAPAGPNRRSLSPGRSRSDLAAFLSVLVAGVASILASATGGWLLGLALAASLSAVLLAFARPPLFLGLAMAFYGSSQFLLQESYPLSALGISINAAQFFMVSLTAILLLRIGLLAALSVRLSSPPRPVLASLLLVLWFGVIFLRSPEPRPALAILLRMLACTAVLLFTYYFVRTFRDFRVIWLGCAVAVIASSGIALLDYILGDSFAAIRAGAYRTAGGFGGPVATGTVAYFGCGLAVLALRTDLLPRGGRALAMLTLGVSIAGIAATFTRTAIVGALLFALFLLLHRGPTARRRLGGRRFVLVALLLSAMLGSFLLLPETAISARTADIPGLSDGAAHLSPGAGSGRILLWTTLIKLQIRSSPLEWLVGHGLYSVASHLRRAIGIHLSAHNSYLEALFDAGLVGFFLYLFFVTSVIRSLRRRGAASSIDGSTADAMDTWRLYYAGYFLSTVMFNGYLYMIGPRWFSMAILGALLGLADSGHSAIQAPAPRGDQAQSMT